MNIIGIDIGGTTIKLGMFTEDENLVFLDEIETKGQMGGRVVLENLMDCMDQFDDFQAIGVSVAGQIDPLHGVIIQGSVNIPGMDGLKIKAILEERYQVPTLVENDVNAAALGENYFGAGKQYKDFLFLAYGTGIGGAIVQQSTLYYGNNGFAGEFGHIITHGDGRLCKCGIFGCYEQYASTTALVREGLKIDPAFKNGRLLFGAWHQGHEGVKRVVADWVEEVALGIISLVHVFNPSSIIIGGGIMEQDFLLNMIQKQVNEQILSSFKEVTLLKTELGNKAGMVGAISLHLKSKDGTV